MSPEGSRQAYLQKWFIALLGSGIALVILVQGRLVLVPLAIAILLFSLMSAAIGRIARLRLGRVVVPVWLATMIVILLAGAAMFSVVITIYSQVDGLIVAGPQYVARAEYLFATMLAWMGEDVARGFQNVFAEIDFAAYIRVLAGQAGQVLVTVTLIILYVGFMFAESVRLPEKLDRLVADERQASNLKQIYRSIIRSVHRYILIKTIVSVFTGVVVYGVMRLFGLHFAETWAMLAVFLNYIPNIGSIIATVLPTLAALAQFDSGFAVLGLLLVIGGIQFTVGNILEPALLGRSLHLSSLVIILSLSFWGAVWGVMGMFLAVPIMMMVMIVCSHVPVLYPLAVLLSRDGIPPSWDDRGGPSA